MTRAVREHIRAQIDRLTRERIIARPLVVDYCTRCGEPFDHAHNSRQEVCGNTSCTRPRYAYARPSAEEQNERRRLRQRANRNTPRGRALRAQRRSAGRAA